MALYSTVALSGLTRKVSLGDAFVYAKLPCRLPKGRLRSLFAVFMSRHVRGYCEY